MLEAMTTSAPSHKQQLHRHPSDPTASPPPNAAAKFTTTEMNFRDVATVQSVASGASRNGPRGGLNDIANFFLVQSSTLIDVTKIDNSILIQSAQMQNFS